MNRGGAGRLIGAGLLLSLLAAGACNKGGDAGPGGTPASGSAAPSPILGIMGRLGNGQRALALMIGRELKLPSPPWEALQRQTSEVIRLAGSLADQEPLEGTRESWAQYAAAFASLASALNKAVQAKNPKEAQAAHKALLKSCEECHSKHRPESDRDG
jgi:hypothetical protein